MARRGPVSDGEWTEYVPDIGDNRRDPEPFTAEIKPLTYAQYTAYQRAALNGDAMARGDAVVRHVISLCVRGVRNYAPYGRDITTGEELLEYGETAAVNDIFLALQDVTVLGAGLRKKSNSPSASSPLVTNAPGPGRALNARAIPPETTSGAHATATATRIAG